MTPTVTLTLPAAWLQGATSCALYTLHNMQVIDIISFDIVDGQPVLRHPYLTPFQEKGTADAQTPA